MQSINWPFLQLIAIQTKSIALILWEVSIKFVQMDHWILMAVQNFMKIVVLGKPADQQPAKFILNNVMKKKGNFDYHILYLPSKLYYK